MANKKAVVNVEERDEEMMAQVVSNALEQDFTDFLFFRPKDQDSFVYFKADGQYFQLAIDKVNQD